MPADLQSVLHQNRRLSDLRLYADFCERSRLGRGLTLSVVCSIVGFTDLETKTCTIPRRRERRIFYGAGLSERWQAVPKKLGTEINLLRLA